MYNTFHNTGTGSVTILVTVLEVTLAKVVHSGIIPVLAPSPVAVTFTAADCTPTVAVICPEYIGFLLGIFRY